jgi:hypothetical protein
MASVRFLNRDAGWGIAVFAIALAVYAATANSSVPFWDGGEFITCAYRLGVAHQPGYPLYALVGRVFTLLRFGLSVAHAVNLMSAVFAALAVLFTFLTGVRLQRAWAEEQQRPSPAWLVRAGAATGALFLAFSATFWDNAIEAEVYSFAAFAMALAGWLAVRWYEIRGRAAAQTLMLMIVYLMGLSIGFHMGAILVFPGILLLGLSARGKELPFLDLAIVTAGMTAFVLSTMGSSSTLTVLSVGLAVAALALALWRQLSQRRSFALAGLALFALGISTYLFLLVRAPHNPPINESDPQTWDTLVRVLRREQYPANSLLVRQAPLGWQLAQFWGTGTWQSGQMAGLRTVGYLQQFNFLPKWGFLDVGLPLGLWLFGMLCQAWGERKVFLALLAIVLTNTLGLVLFLNFTTHEVRDRDYFFSGGYQFLALFLGLGAGGGLRVVWLTWRERPGLRAVAAALAILLVALAAMPALLGPLGHPKYHEHDRRGDLLARNYAYNILAGVPPNSILFTGGDNDTFPVWYLQYVEGVRRDVRVVNLSLINLPWYIKQLKDEEPRVPITWNNDQINGKTTIIHRDFKTEFRTRLVAQQLPDNTVLWVRDMAMWHIIHANEAGPRKPLYFAVTTEDDFMKDFLPYLVMEGMVYRFEPAVRSEDNQPRIDSAKVLANFFDGTYDLTGELDNNGNLDTSHFRDINTSRLLGNYPAALSRAAYDEAKADRYDNALRALQLAYHMEPTFPAVVELLPLAYLQLHQIDPLLAAGRFYLRALPDPTNVAFSIGKGLVTLAEMDKALAWAQEFAAARPATQGSVSLLYQVRRARGENAQAEQVLADWVARSGDKQAAAELERFRQSLRQPGAPAPAAPGSTAPPPTTPGPATPAPPPARPAPAARVHADTQTHRR